MNDHRRQAEIINQMRLVLITEIGQVFKQRQIGFGNEQNIGMYRRGRQSQCLDDLVRLIQIDRTGPGHLPDKADGIQPHDPDAMFKIFQNDLQDFKKHIRVAVIQIDLIIAERAPDMLFTIRCRDLA